MIAAAPVQRPVLPWWHELEATTDPCGISDPTKASFSGLGGTVGSGALQWRGTKLGSVTLKVNRVSKTTRRVAGGLCICAQA